MEWWNQAHEDLCETVTLILLFYIGSSVIEPEAIQDMTKHLMGMANAISKYVYNFWPNNKAFSKRDSYQMYCKIHVSTNVFGEDLQQMNEDLKGVLNKVLVSSRFFNALTHKLLPGFQHLIATWIGTGFPCGLLRNVLHSRPVPVTTLSQIWIKQCF
jgi:hypothetical protein